MIKVFMAIRMMVRAVLLREDVDRAQVADELERLAADIRSGRSL